eukprot:1144935-Pelagomonas_calceolata.AAC.7
MSEDVGVGGGDLREGHQSQGVQHWLGPLQTAKQKQYNGSSEGYKVFRVCPEDDLLSLGSTQPAFQKSRVWGTAKKRPRPGVCVKR